MGVYPLRAPMDVLTATLLRPDPLTGITFAVDMNVGKLATLLRMAGFDTFYKNTISDLELAEVATQQKRILLSKDKDLLKRKTVVFGYLVREVYPKKQLGEVIHLFGLRDQVKPLTRCLNCNAPLHAVGKQQILDQLEPLTKKYYNDFRRCPLCNKIYWPGSHRDNMLTLLNSCGVCQNRN